VSVATPLILLLVALSGAAPAWPAANKSAVSAPDREDFVEYIRYEYSPEGDLVAAFDALGHPMRMGYDRHLLIKETKRSGLSFHFAYEGRGNDDRCAAPRGTVSPNGKASAQAMLPPWEARFMRDQLGLEIERTLPGGVRARWERDLLGRPLKHEIWSGTAIVSAKAYSWEPCRVGSSPALPVTNHRGRVWEPSQGSHFKVRLKLIVDALNGPVQYRHDGLGNLTAAIYADGKVDLRMPDAVGNLFKTSDKKDRKYGPAGQLLESTGPQGTTKYEYDPEGNLAKKLLPDGSEWKYEWNGAGMLAKVLRPDGKTGEFGYDPLGRRTWKKYGAKTTKWIWDGNVPVHEWVEVDPQGLEDPPAQHEAADWESGLTARKFALCKRHHLGLRARILRADRQAHRDRPLRHRHRPSRHPHRHARRARQDHVVCRHWCVRRLEERDGGTRCVPLQVAWAVRGRRDGAVLQPVQVLRPGGGGVCKPGSDWANRRSCGLSICARRRINNRPARSLRFSDAAQHGAEQP
jgi:YD repeat-containing protein